MFFKKSTFICNYILWCMYVHIIFTVFSSNPVNHSISHGKNIAIPTIQIDCSYKEYFALILVILLINQFYAVCLSISFYLTCEIREK